MKIWREKLRKIWKYKGVGWLMAGLFDWRWWTSPWMNSFYIYAFMHFDGSRLEDKRKEQFSQSTLTHSAHEIKIQVPCGYFFDSWRRIKYIRNKIKNTMVRISVYVFAKKRYITRKHDQDVYFIKSYQKKTWVLWGLTDNERRTNHDSWLKWKFY